MKMLLEIILLIAVIALVICLFFYFTPMRASPTRVAESSVCFWEKCFSVELAETNAQRETGLMNRRELDKDKGMLFIFDREGIYPFWMKDTFIPLDMIWLDGNYKVVFISENAQPCKTLICPVINPKVEAKYVLEINAGLVKEMNLKVGDQLKIPR